MALWKTAVAFLFALLVLASAAATVHAEDGDGCPDGYAWGSAPYQAVGPDGQPMMIQNTGCRPIQRDNQKYWGTIAYATLGDRIFAFARWNGYNGRTAEKQALADCKKGLKADGIKAKCIIAGSGYNGTAWVTRGAAMRLFFGYDQEEAMAKCQNTTTECRVYAKVISDGSDASGVVWVDG